MSKRITLTDYEIEQIVASLNTAINTPAWDYQVIEVGKHTLQSLVNKLQAPVTSAEPGFDKLPLKRGSDAE